VLFNGTRPDRAVNRFLGLDYGRRRVGVAVAERGAWNATRVCTLERSRRLGHDIEQIERLAGLHRADAIVLGLPLNADGSEGAIALEVRQFGQALAKRINLPLLFHNEYGTSVDAESDMVLIGIAPRKHRELVDQLAAVHLLESFLNTLREPPESEVRI